MDSLPDTAVIESIVRRHLPACYRLEGVELASQDATSGNPAPFRVMATIQRISTEPDPGGWGHTLGREIRAGWDSSEFSLDVRHLPSEFEDVVGRYANDGEAA